MVLHVVAAVQVLFCVSIATDPDETLAVEEPCALDTFFSTLGVARPSRLERHQS